MSYEQGKIKRNRLGHCCHRSNTYIAFMSEKCEQETILYLNHQLTEVLKCLIEPKRK